MKNKNDLKNDITHLAAKYATQLDSVLLSLVRDNRMTKGYSHWRLSDFHRMIKFYNLLMFGKHKTAFNQLRTLWKEDHLVPNKIAKKLFDSFPNDYI